MNTRTVDNVELWDLSAEEIVAEASIDGAPVRWHFKPYGVGAAKNLLKSVANKFKILPGGLTEAVGGDPAAFVSFFDAHFIRMSNVTGENGEELSIEAQKEWLAGNPQIKVDVINSVFKPDTISVEDEQAINQKAVLTIKATAESVHKVKAWNSGNLELKITHRMLRPSAKDRMEYDRSVSRNRMDSKHNTIQVLMDYDLVDSLYERLIQSIEGSCNGDNPCTLERKIEWVRKVPFWWRTYAVDEVFSKDRIKNG